MAQSIVFMDVVGRPLRCQLHRRSWLFVPKQVISRDRRDGPARGWPLFNMAGRANLADILLKIIGINVFSYESCCLDLQELIKKWNLVTLTYTYLYLDVHGMLRLLVGLLDRITSWLVLFSFVDLFSIGQRLRWSVCFPSGNQVSIWMNWRMHNGAAAGISATRDVSHSSLHFLSILCHKTFHSFAANNLTSSHAKKNRNPSGNLWDITNFVTSCLLDF